jgi:hypothetical protein
MTNAQVRVDYIRHARGHYIVVNRYRYVIKTRKQGRDAELAWKCAEKDCPGPAHTRDNVIPRFNRDHNHPPARADIDAKKFLVTVGESACKTLDPLPNLYDSEIIKFRNREWDDYTQSLTNAY